MLKNALDEKYFPKKKFHSKQFSFIYLRYLEKIELTEIRTLNLLPQLIFLYRFPSFCFTILCVWYLISSIFD